MDNIGSVGRAAKVVRRLRKKGEFLVIVNLQVRAGCWTLDKEAEKIGAVHVAGGWSRVYPRDSKRAAETKQTYLTVSI